MVEIGKNFDSTFLIKQGEEFSLGVARPRSVDPERKSECKGEDQDEGGSNQDRDFREWNDFDGRGEKFRIV